MQTSEIIMLILLVFLIILILGLGYFIYSKSKNKSTTTEVKNFEQLTPVLENIKSNVDNQYKVQNDNTKDTSTKLAETLERIKTSTINNNQKFFELKQEVTSLKDDQLKTLSDKQLETFNQLKNLIENVQKVDQQVVDLNNIFYNTKQRGTIGELTLETLLTNLLGSNNKVWEAQYDLATDSSSGKGKVDFIIHTSNQGEDIAIDSKFPLDNYRALLTAMKNRESDATVKTKKDDFKKDIKAKIGEVTKYLNKKNNLNSIILFIPSDSIFDFVADEFPDLIEDASKKKVWLTAPTGLGALLNIINQYLKDYELSHNLEKIKGLIIKIQDEYTRFDKRWDDIKKSNEKLYSTIKDFDTTINKISVKQQQIIDYEFEEERQAE